MASEMSSQPRDGNLQRQLTAAALSRTKRFPQAIQRFLQGCKGKVPRIAAARELMPGCGVPKLREHCQRFAFR
jgi:hypothetical protein